MALLYEGVTTVAAFAAMAVAGTAFVPGPAQQRSVQVAVDAPNVGQPTAPAPASLSEKLGTSGLVAYGAGAGVLAAVASAMNRSRGGRRVQRQAAKKGDIAVAEKKTAAVSKLAYLDSIPDSIASRELVESIIKITPQAKLEDPDEGSLAYLLKLYAETYGTGPGKAKKMGWLDFWTLKFTKDSSVMYETGTPTGEWSLTPAKADFAVKREQQRLDQMAKGIVPMLIPGPGTSVLDSPDGASATFWESGATFKWRGPEPFAGDQVRSLIVDGKFAKDFLGAIPWYRKGMKPWQRGIEIGMAHGYFIIGPFVWTGRLNQTPEGPTVGLLCGLVLIAAASFGGLGFGTVMKPKLFDEPGDEPGKGFTELINWHLVGGIGGAGFAHALYTLFAVS